ncbi:MAG TPA: hypothetical protein PLJ47_00535 [Candidatus Hydrogenedentes bacterium]|mgnify:CR=1 FL=1|nr:hypothetical protein [Candidatus Hydrogenedentota bacterium]
MPKFAYKAIDNAGVEQYGVLEAASEADAVNEVGRRGLFPTDVRPANVTDDLRVLWNEQQQKLKELEAKKNEQHRKRQTRQRLVVRYKDGRTEYGVCFALNPRDSGFHLDKVDASGITSGQTVHIRFSELKAVFYVKSFDGKYDKSQQFREWAPEGHELVIEFNDGEILRGSSMQHYDPDDARFFIVPQDPTTNNISVMVEKTAVKRIMKPEEYEASRTERHEARKAAEKTELTQEETMGDFYFETRNYPAAHDQYKVALKKFPQSSRLRKKLVAAQFNIGVQFIKRREYGSALECMQKVLEMDPGNEHARKKAVQLRKIVEHPERAPGPKTVEHDF